MSITLRPEHEELVLQALRTGAYCNADEVIGCALELLLSEDERLHGNKDLIRETIERAFRQFENGEFYSAEESRADLDERKAAWLTHFDLYAADHDSAQR